MMQGLPPLTTCDDLEQLLYRSTKPHSHLACNMQCPLPHSNGSSSMNTRAGTPSVPARASKPCVPPLREARSQSFMKWRSSRICAPAPTSEGRCSLAWWPQKYSWPPEGIVARTQARAPQASQRFAAVSCGSFSTGRSRVCAFMLPSHTITPPRAPLFTRGAIDRPHADTMKRGSGNHSNDSPNTPRNGTHQRDLAPASSIVESVPDLAPRAPLATNER